MMDREIVLDEAKKVIKKDRQDQYGKPENNFKKIADMWSAYKGVDITPGDVCLMMCMLKMARISTGSGKSDNYVDLCGYAALAYEMDVKEKPEIKLPSTLSIMFEETPECFSVSHECCGGCVD